MRVKMLAGNWKMNKLNAELPGFFETFAKELVPDFPKAYQGKVEVVFAAPFTLLMEAARLGARYGIRAAAQNVHHEANGAFTGETSLPMLKEIGVTTTLIGHSERRQYFAETDDSVKKKTVAALAQGVTPIVCVGETLAEREKNQTEAVVTRQVAAVLEAVAEPQDLIIAYEPVWAIGTGRSATSAQAQEVHKLIRGLVRARYGSGKGDAMRLLYGGSANPANIDELLKQPDIDGGLVGGASLKPQDFAKMVRAAR